MLRVVRREAAGGAPDLPGALHPVLRRVYQMRGIRASEELDLTLERLLPLSSLEHVGAAVELLRAHRGGRVLVVGDFDADGATSSALVVRALRAWGYAAVDYLVPNRFEYGYGLTPEIVELALERRPTLIITVDNGVSSLAGVARARAQGVEVLVTDHHLPGAELPAASVIVNPNLPGSAFASRALAGVGVAFYVMAALRRALQAQGELAEQAPRATEFLDLVALGTVADVVPFDANNRILVAQGLRRIRAGRCVPGIRALLEIAARRGIAHTLEADLAFAVAPRLNAAGRIDDMSIGIQCLLADDAAQARQLAGRLDALNQERRSIEARMQEEALRAVRILREPVGPARAGVCLYDPGWHQGVVGLVASRIRERLRRPVIAFAPAADGLLRGSARSSPGIHVRDVLERIAAREPDLIARFGGHAMAAGLSLAPAQLDRFAREFDAEVGRCGGGGAADAIETDGELALAEIALETAHALRDGGPWGQAFPEPSFDGVFAVRNARIVGERHVKMWVEMPGTGRSFDAIAFNHLGPDAATTLPAGPVQLVYRLDVNEYQGEHRLQLLVDHVLPSA